jgi:hypothetical protein
MPVEGRLEIRKAVELAQLLRSKRRPEIPIALPHQVQDRLAKRRAIGPIARLTALLRYQSRRALGIKRPSNDRLGAGRPP